HWVMIALIILAGLATMISMTRAGIDLLWTPGEESPSRLSLIEVTPIGLLLVVCLALMLGAGPVMYFMQETAAALYDPGGYIEAAGPAAPVVDQNVTATSGALP